MEQIYRGTYPARKISKDDVGIKLPDGTKGDYAIYEGPPGDFQLKKVGEKTKV